MTFSVITEIKESWLRQCISKELNGTMDLCVIFCILLPSSISEPTYCKRVMEVTVSQRRISCS